MKRIIKINNIPKIKKINKMVTYKELKEKYIDSKESIKENWDGEYELCSSSAEIKLLNNPKLVEMYIKKYNLCSNSEIKLLNNPKLVEMYIKKYKLCSSSAEEKLLNTPKLVEMYIKKWGISDNLKEIIMEGVLE